MKQQNLKQKKDIAPKSKEFRSWILWKVIDKDKNNSLNIWILDDPKIWDTQLKTEMPTSGDLKSGDCPFFTTPTPTPPPRKIDPAPNGNDLEHYMTSYIMYILSKFEIIILMLEIIFVND